MKEKSNPTIAVAISMLSGILYLINGISEIQSVMTTMSRTNYMYDFSYPFMREGLQMGIEGAVVGIIIIVCAYIAYSRPVTHIKVGIIILIISILSFFIGFSSSYAIFGTIGIIGGLLTILWKPPTVVEEVKAS